MKKRHPFLSKNSRRFGLGAAFVIVLSLNSYAQTAPSKQWDKTIGGPGGDGLRAVKQTLDGGYILGGTSVSNASGDKSQNGKGNNDYWIVKTDALGTKVWDKTFGGTNRDDFYALEQTSDGGYIIGGYSTSGVGGDKTQPSRGNSDFWILKLDANGNKIWDKTFGSTVYDELWALAQTSDGGYILGGHSNSPISGDKTQPSIGVEDYWIIKIDGSGNKQWDKTFGGNGPDNLFTLQQTADGGYIAGGGSSSNLSGDKSQAQKGVDDFWIVKMDAAGNKQWDKTIGGNNIENLYSLQQTPDGGYILGGESSSNVGGDKSQPSRGLDDYWVVKIDDLGNKLWDKTFGGAGDDELASLDQTIDGGYILGGSSNSGVSGDKSQSNLGVNDFWIVKIDASGNKMWDKTLGALDNEFVTSIHQTMDGGYILGGPSGSGIGMDKSQPSQGGSDYWIVKLAADVLGAEEIFLTQGNKLSQNQPNPFSKKTTISFSLAQPEEIELTIYNSLGQTVAKHQKKYVAGKNQVQWEEITSGKKLKAGTYFYILSAGEFQATKRMVLLD